MNIKIYPPFDATPYPADPDSVIADPAQPDRAYVYAQKTDGTIYIAPDRPHQHPKILGGAEAVRYAGDIRLQRGKLLDITNLSGTFRCDEPDGLLAAAQQFVQQGFVIKQNAIRFFPPNGGKPIILG